MLINKKITVLFIIFLAVIFLFPDIVMAQSDPFGVNELNNTVLGTKDLTDTIAGIINIFLGFLGILATLIILYGGFIWMTSQGSADKIDRAKRIIINGVIGLVIILSAYAIARFLLRESGNAFFGGGGGGGQYHGGQGMGGGVLENHYPARNATDIPRNTNIYITFNEPMNLNFVTTNGCNPNYTECIDDSYIQLIDEDDNVILGADLMVQYDANHQVFEINPYGNDPNNHLGNAGGSMRYQAVLINLETGNGQPAFPFTGFYDWYFTVNNELDLIPPEVTSVLPVDGSTNNPRNSAVQMNFSEAVNPIFAAGVYPPFQNITLAGANILNGSYLISNQYRTVEFITDELCGVNSCGGDVYCLPGNENLTGTVTTAIEDMAGNSLANNYIWSFGTNDTIDLTPPYIISMDSGADLSLDDPIEAVFSKNLLSSSVNSEHINLVKVPNLPVNYWLRVVDNNTVSVRHDRFDPLTQYTPTFSSGIQDILQNCWYPCVCDDPGGSCACDQDPTQPCAAGTRCEGPDV
ncbi:MAG: hypothetical protein COV55_01395 [Candidatus Komeilibacteria bacterium CG11_big_fil_rev_8_21_14_0_20_36_20]|uniref:SbsA Ig-like domain-containing protein n=1 Tax=Candidatus Komeilibacteria bacterium CG11_big_fil_rev_8_21_14_0_20_36_20 TaxID=1974477 RepID=A0A2H0NFY2_9BACT|nr:MAG: hypothetical protein COV55_01395 [Candidatus Komeilibacteria bacterium CG11_big_fil_rev_8_21_14_0_20_36_20]PIR81197.1 MAG: hypothetical protein COU21_04380 [Candidatus Komeilibacteria bacterium CG10_big_fil_rev_8_21_14_0_10_36_65]PJC55161.1 MAG: hypothetical protein CO027_03320 [Candidatus Komeilibacteria bacterium CG_4_9_14_0_2_um_filter_36_13]